MTYIISILFSFSLLFTAKSQVNFASLVKVYKKGTLAEAKKILQTIPEFQLGDLSTRDTLTGKIQDGQLTAYVKHSRTNLRLTFTDSVLYKSLYEQAEDAFKYSADLARGTRGNGFTRHWTTFSNYEGAKIGSLEVLLVTVTSENTDKIDHYELLLFPYHEN